MRNNPLFLILAIAAFGCLIAAWITDKLWLGVGFFVFGGLMFVLFPNRSAGAPEDEPSQFAWVIPDSQPARTIVAFVIGLLCLGIAAALVLS